MIVADFRKMNREGFDDDEIYGLAVHYYDEADCKADGAVPQCRIVCNTKVDLTEEEMKELRQKAQQDYYEEQIKKQREANAKKAAKKKAEEVPQQSLFDFM